MKEKNFRFWQRVQRIPPIRLVWIGVFIFICYFTFLAFARHDNYYSLRLDLGNMDQTVWNVAHGHGFTLTDPMGTAQESRLSVHADFLLILLAPFYLVWSDPRMLLLVQVVVMALGALPVYWIAKDRLKSAYLPVLFAGIYLLYPPLERMALDDFHAVALSMTFLLFAYWYLIKNRILPFLLFVVLAAFGKEQIWITVGLLSLFMAWRHKRIGEGVTFAVASFFIFYYLLWKVIPAVTPTGQHFALTYLSEFGDKQNVILKNIMLHPLQVFTDAVAPDRLFYYFQLLAPVAFLPIFSPLALIFAAPSLAINVLSNNPLMRVIDYQYTSDITPFLMVASIEGYAVVSSLFRSRKPWLLWGMGICLLGASLWWGELPYGVQSRFGYFTTPPRAKAIMDRVAREIGPMYTVSATNNIGAHVAERQFLYNFPVNATTSDYSIAILGDQYAWPSGDAQKKAVEELLKSPNYTLIAHWHNFFAFKRKGI